MPATAPSDEREWAQTRAVRPTARSYERRMEPEQRSAYRTRASGAGAMERELRDTTERRAI
ncbi:hypothetical protein [Galactobacillus timonensis]|uniref:hypothetical protein n=1 Tax=Galactobacillus timonensis TaxID=2041840 RepID=UPI00108408E4|nr:hypothetical protein [Galactobacillus timonensis]